MGTFLPLSLTMKPLLLSSLLSSLSLSSPLVPAPRPMSDPVSNQTRSTMTQFVDCYDYTNQGGQKIHVQDYTPALRTINFDNRIESCCFTGVWLLYDLENYGQGSLNSMDWWVYVNNYCTNVPAQFSNRASSLRFTGAPNDWNYDTINMYFNEYFIGDEEFTYTDAPVLNYPNRAQSIVVTGCQPWTIYELAKYRGASMCLYPEDATKCTPGFYSTRQPLGRLAGQVSSVRKGCHSSVRVKPDNDGLTVKEMRGEERGFTLVNRNSREGDREHFHGVVCV